MSWTKRQLITQSFEEIGLASFVADMDADQLQSAKRRLDSMMATWNGKGIRIGYALSASADGGDIDDESGIPDAAVEAVYLNLALRNAASFGKAVSAEVKTNAKLAYDVLLSNAAFPIEMRIGSIPAGAGHKLVDSTFLPIPNNNPLMNSDNDQLIFNGD